MVTSILGLIERDLFFSINENISKPHLLINILLKVLFSALLEVSMKYCLHSGVLHIDISMVNLAITCMPVNRYLGAIE